MLLAPVWALQLAITAKSFRDNPVIGAAALNRIARHREGVQIADSGAAGGVAGPECHVLREWREAFNRNGVAVIADRVFAAEISRATLCDPFGQLARMPNGAKAMQSHAHCN